MKHFVNLTNGIEAIPSLNGDYSFIRVQSSICEAKAWNKLLLDLDNNFLMSLALGYECHVYDYSNRKEVPRALYQGMEFVKWILRKRWFNVDSVAVVNHANCQSYFNGISLDKTVKKKLDYYKKFLCCQDVNIVIHGGRTVHDGDYGYYKDFLCSLGQQKVTKEER